MRNTLDLLASLSRLAIAAAIVYFAWQLAQINAGVGPVTQAVDEVTRQIPPTLEEVREIRLEVAQIRGQIPAVLAEVEQLRAQIPAILAQANAIERQIPPILERVDQSLAVVEQTQRQIPQILATTDNAIAELGTTREQVVPLVPLALEEVRLTREKVDPTLDRVEILVDDAFARADSTIAGVSEAGKQASEGAVKGFFTGLIKLPFQLVGTLASPLIKTLDPAVAELLTERDLELMHEVGSRAVKAGELEREMFWSNPDSGNSGSVTILRLFDLQRNECVEARITISNRGKKVQDKTSEFCRDAEGKWLLASEVGKNAP